MAGGRREGAGRKAGEKTVVRRIPVGCLPAVDAVIAEHRKTVTAIKDGIKLVTEINGDGKKDVTEIKGAEVGLLESVTEINGGLKAVTEINQGNSGGQKSITEIKKPLNREQQEAMRKLEKLHSTIVKRIKADHGSLFNAVLNGIRSTGKEARMFPDKVDRRT